MPCSVQNSKAIVQLNQKLWANEISQDLSLRWVSADYPILHTTPGDYINISPLHEIHIFQYMRKIFCVEFQRVSLKFHTKYLTLTLKDKFLYNGVKIWRALRCSSSVKDKNLYKVEIMRTLRYKSSLAFLKRPLGFQWPVCCTTYTIPTNTIYKHDLQNRIRRITRLASQRRHITWSKEPVDRIRSIRHVPQILHFRHNAVL